MSGGGLSGAPSAIPFDVLAGWRAQWFRLEREAEAKDRRQAIIDGMGTGQWQRQDAKHAQANAPPADG
jgi:hypothetical protein